MAPDSPPPVAPAPSGALAPPPGGARPSSPAPAPGGSLGTAPVAGAGAVPPSVQAAAAWSWRLLVVVAATAVVAWLLTVLKTIAVPVAVALLLAVLLSPVVQLLQRARLPRVAASGVAVIGLVAVVGGLLAVAGTSVAQGIGELWDQASQGVEALLAWLAAGPLGLSPETVDGWWQQLQGALADSGSQLVSGALKATETVGAVLAGALIALFCTFFFLLDGRAIWTWVVRLLPLRARDRAHQAGRRGWVTLGGYTRTQILVAAVDAVGIGVSAAVLRVPLALPLAVLVFLGSFVPIVGALVTGAVAVLVALVAQGPGVALIMLAAVLAVQQLEGHVLQPFLMGHAVSLHPVAVLLVVAGGSLVAGIIGALLAVPIAATLNTVVLYLHGHDKFPRLGTDDTLVFADVGPATGEGGAVVVADPPR